MQSKIVVCAPVCCVKMEQMTACPCCPVLAAQSRVLPPTVLKIFLSLPLSPVLSLSSPSHALTKHITHSLTLVMLALLYLLCKVRRKVLLSLFSFRKRTLNVRSIYRFENVWLVISFLFLDYTTIQLCFCISDICSAK